MTNYKLNTKYEAFSLIEMLITVVILGLLMLTCAIVLTTLIRVSTVASNKARVRTESEYMQELLKRTIRGTDPVSAKLYASPGRYYIPESSIVLPAEGEGTPYASELGEGEFGNEIHLRPFGSNRWICVGFFLGHNNEEESDGTPKGYILKTTMEDTEYSPEGCFNSAENNPLNYIVLNSRFVNVSEMEISYTITEDSNKEFVLNLHADAIYWYFAKGAPIKKDLYRQSIVKTEGIMW